MSSFFIQKEGKSKLGWGTILCSTFTEIMEAASDIEKKSTTTK